MASKKRIAALASAVTALGVSAIAATMVLGGGGAGGAHAATASATSYTATHMTVTRTGNSATVPTGVKADTAVIACANDTDIPVASSNCNAAGNDGRPAPKRTRPAPNTAFNGKHGNANSGGANAHGKPFQNAGQIGTNINGISDVSSRSVNGFHVTPPDQALCVGNAGALEQAGLNLGVPANTSVVLEGVNEAWQVYSTSGQSLYGPDTLVNLFGDPNASGDILCHYDPATQSFYLGEIGVMMSGPDAYNAYGTDLVVFSPTAGYVSYQIDTSENANCFPDFPQQGFDNNAYYLTINEFCGVNQDFAGAAIFALPKAPLVAGASSINGAVFGNLAPNNTPVLTLQPAYGNGTDTEYLVNANVYDAAGYGVESSSSLGFWTITGDKNLASGGSLTLNYSPIASETYGFPVDALSTGTGTHPAGAPSFTTSEKYLTPDDSRLGQVQYSDARGGRLFTSLDTALTVGSDPTVVDGAAWFEIDPKSQHIHQQGYVAAQGTYLLYPTVSVGNSGTEVLSFSMTGANLNPSAGYVSKKDTAFDFGSIQTAAVGSGPHLSFCDVICGRPRWGDYSVTVADPNSNDIWMANEYIPPTNEGGSDLVDNWGTRVWSVKGASN